METASLQLPKDLIEAAIESRIQQALSETFADNKQVIGSIVSSVINAKVDENLQPSRYSDAKPLIETTLNKALRELVAEVLNKNIRLYEKEVEAAIMGELKKKNSPMIKDLVRAMGKGMAGAVDSKYRFSVTVSDS